MASNQRQRYEPVRMKVVCSFLLVEIIISYPEILIDLKLICLFLPCLFCLKILEF